MKRRLFRLKHFQNRKLLFIYKEYIESIPKPNINFAEIVAVIKNSLMLAEKYNFNFEEEPIFRAGV